MDPKLITKDNIRKGKLGYHRPVWKSDYHWCFKKQYTELGWLLVEIGENNWTIVTEQKPSTKRPKERPRQRRKDTVDKDLEGLGIENGVELAKERNRQKQMVVTAMGLNSL